MSPEGLPAGCPQFSPFQVCSVFKKQSAKGDKPFYPISAEWSNLVPFLGDAGVDQSDGDPYFFQRFKMSNQNESYLLQPFNQETKHEL